MCVCVCVCVCVCHIANSQDAIFCGVKNLAHAGPLTAHTRAWVDLPVGTLNSIGSGNAVSTNYSTGTNRGPAVSPKYDVGGDWGALIAPPPPPQLFSGWPPHQTASPLVANTHPTQPSPTLALVPTEESWVPRSCVQQLCTFPAFNSRMKPRRSCSKFQTNQ